MVARIADRARMAVDVSGPNAVSSNYNKRTSLFNPEEAYIIVSLAKGPLSYVLQLEPRHVNMHEVATPQNIAINTPFTDQE